MSPSDAGGRPQPAVGVLALQMDFISREALIAGMQAWVFDKAKPWARSLSSRGPFSRSATLLETLVGGAR